MKEELLYKYLSGICSLKEKRDIEKWLEESEENFHYFWISKPFISPDSFCV
ncbi:MAG: hypothetical protein LUH10_00725 [Tannerellaceae bacterium]|nr:hypothetical protein [Tannerellaceae bacterium]